MKIVGIVVLSVLALFGLSWAVEGNDFFLYKFFAPKQAEVQRQVFEQTRSYRQGMIQELENMQFQYESTTDVNAKSALAQIIIHRAAGFDLNDSDVPYTLRVFIQKLQEGNGQ